jgi:hypothetical protein
MKIITAFSVLLIVCDLPNPGSARGLKGCDEFRALCLARPNRTPEQCKILFDAAIKSGGQWYMPEAVAAARLPPGRSGNCMP